MAEVKVEVDDFDSDSDTDTIVAGSCRVAMPAILGNFKNNIVGSDCSNKENVPVQDKPVDKRESRMGEGEEVGGEMEEGELEDEEEEELLITGDLEYDNVKAERTGNRPEEIRRESQVELSQISDYTAFGSEDEDGQEKDEVIEVSANEANVKDRTRDLTKPVGGGRKDFNCSIDDCHCCKVRKCFEEENALLRNIILELNNRNTEVEDFLQVEFGLRYKSFRKHRRNLIQLGFGEDLEDPKSVTGRRTNKTVDVIKLLALVKEQEEKPDVKPSSPPPKSTAPASSSTSQAGPPATQLLTLDVSTCHPVRPVTPPSIPGPSLVLSPFSSRSSNSLLNPPPPNLEMQSIQLESGVSPSTETEPMPLLFPMTAKKRGRDFTEENEEISKKAKTSENLNDLVDHEADPFKDLCFKCFLKGHKSPECNLPPSSERSKELKAEINARKAGLKNNEIGKNFFRMERRRKDRNRKGNRMMKESNPLPVRKLELE